MHKRQHDTIAVVDLGGPSAHLAATLIRRAHVFSEIRHPHDAPSAFAGVKGIVLAGTPTPNADAKNNADTDFDTASVTAPLRDLAVPILDLGTDGAAADDSPERAAQLANFALTTCGCAPTWTMDAYIDAQVLAIQQQMGDQSAFLLASGGVDSNVAARLLSRAIGGERLHLLHVDNGMMRKGESARVLEMYRDMGLDQHLHFVDASDAFLQALGTAVAPEEKRAIIGQTFVDVFEREARRLGIENHLLAQGTIYPDTVETGTAQATAVKTHHNRVPVIEEMIAAGRVIEPLAELYKVEVRELGERLGLPHDAIWRHPFPGPGLGVRLLCAEGGASSEADTAALTESAAPLCAPHGLVPLVLPMQSVGMQFHRRTYQHPLLLQGPSDLDRDLEALLPLVDTLLQSVPGINRCLLSLGAAPITSAKTLRAHMIRARLDLLREADAIVMDGLKRHGLYDRIWQCPTVLAPLEINGTGAEFCIVRPIHSERAMTASAALLPAPLLAELRAAILALPGISGLAIDLTPKPPGTIEWE